MGVELGFGKCLAVNLGAHERADYIIPGVLLAIDGELVRVHEHLGGGGLPVRRRRLVLRVVEADHPVAPLENHVPVFDRDAHKLEDDLQGQLGGDVVHEIAFASLSDPVNDLVRDFPDVRFYRDNDLRREPFAD